jgi:hypothetical protein
MACIASTFTGSVAALKASKVQVRIFPPIGPFTGDHSERR